MGIVTIDPSTQSLKELAEKTNLEEIWQQQYKMEKTINKLEAQLNATDKPFDELVKVQGELQKK